MRVVASTGASLAASVSAGLSALSGPRHGGQTSLVEILFEESERFGDAARLVQERLRRGDILPGFGHPLYRNDDPRALAILPLLPPDPTRDAMSDAMDLIRGKQPNVDFAWCPCAARCASNQAAPSPCSRLAAPPAGSHTRSK